MFKSFRGEMATSGRVAECEVEVGLASVAIVLCGGVRAVGDRVDQLKREFPVQGYGTTRVDHRVVYRVVGGGPDWDDDQNGGLAFCSLLRSRSCD